MLAVSLMTFSPSKNAHACGSPRIRVLIQPTTRVSNNHAMVTRRDGKNASFSNYLLCHPGCRPLQERRSKGYRRRLWCVLVSTPKYNMRWSGGQGCLSSRMWWQTAQTRLRELCDSIQFVSGVAGVSRCFSVAKLILPGVPSAKKQRYYSRASSQVPGSEKVQASSAAVLSRRNIATNCEGVS